MLKDKQIVFKLKNYPSDSDNISDMQTLSTLNPDKGA